MTRWWFQLCFIFIPIWEMIQFDEHIFQMGWNHQLDGHVPKKRCVLRRFFKQQVLLQHGPAMDLQDRGGLWKRQGWKVELRFETARILCLRWCFRDSTTMGFITMKNHKFGQYFSNRLLKKINDMGSKSKNPELVYFFNDNCHSSLWHCKNVCCLYFSHSHPYMHMNRECEDVTLWLVNQPPPNVPHPENQGFW